MDEDRLSPSSLLLGHLAHQNQSHRRVRVRVPQGAHADVEEVLEGQASEQRRIMDRRSLRAISVVVSFVFLMSSISPSPFYTSIIL